jgi:hypothetical protein
MAGDSGDLVRGAAGLCHAPRTGLPQPVERAMRQARRVTLFSGGVPALPRGALRYFLTGHLAWALVIGSALVGGILAKVTSPHS